MPDLEAGPTERFISPAVERRTPVEPVTVDGANPPSPFARLGETACAAIPPVDRNPTPIWPGRVLVHRTSVDLAHRHPACRDAPRCAVRCAGTRGCHTCAVSPDVASRREQPPQISSGSAGTSPNHRRWVLAAAVIAILAVGGWWLLTSFLAAGSGDPHGKIMNQITPAATAIPGYGTAALPVVNQPPQSLSASYILMTEPHRDSCDGIAGTQGWSPVAVQARFEWTGGLPALASFMEPRLTTQGWTTQPNPHASFPPGQSWTKTLENGTQADLTLTQEGGPTTWQFEAIAQPAGKAAGGC